MPSKKTIHAHVQIILFIGEATENLSKYNRKKYHHNVWNVGRGAAACRAKDVLRGVDIPHEIEKIL